MVNDDESSERDGPDDDATTDGADVESEHRVTRAAAAAALRDLADGVDAGTVNIGAGEDVATATIPETLDFEIEYEHEGDESEIEVELEWHPGDAPADVTAATAEDGDLAVDHDTEDEEASDDSSVVETAAGRPVVETATVAASEPPGGGAAGSTEPGESSHAVESDEPGESVEPVASVVETEAPVTSQARFELFRDRADEWRWRLVHRNGNVIASSGEGYIRKHNAAKGLQSVMRNAPGAEVAED